MLFWLGIRLYRRLGESEAFLVTLALYLGRRTIKGFIPKPDVQVVLTISYDPSIKENKNVLYQNVLWDEKFDLCYLVFLTRG